MRGSRLAGLALLVTLTVASESQAELRAGFGVQPLPAAEGGALAGYGGLRARRARELLDPPAVSALVVERDGRRIAWLSADLLIATARLRAGLESVRSELGVQTLAFVATHTHSGPGGYLEGWLAGRVTGAPHADGRAEEMIQAASAALRAAVRDLAPARLASAETTLDLARNRRRADGPRERALRVLRIDLAADRAPIAVLAYGAHPTVLSPASRAYSGDFPAAAREWLAERGWRVVFLPGPLGDQAPGDPDADLNPAEQRAQLAKIGTQMGQAAANVLDTLAPDDDARVRAVERWADAPRVRLRRFCAIWWLWPLTGGAVHRLLSDRVQFQAYRLGSARIVALPAEPTADLARALQERLGDSSVWVVSHANDWLGYALSRGDYARGGYEACLSFHGAEFGPWLLEQAEETITLLDSAR